MRRPLRDLADVHYGKSPNAVVHEDGSIPVVGTGGVYGQAVRPLFQGPAIVVPRKGSLANPQYMSGPFWAVDTTYAVLPKKGVQARWLHYNLDLFDLTKLNEATGVPSISRDWLYKIEFEDPGETSQRRIAEMLSAIDDAIEQTEALIAKTQQIKAGLMHDLFTRGVTADGQLRPPREEAPQLYKKSSLGWIPTKWDVEPLGRLGAFMNGLNKPKDQFGFGMKFVNISDVYPERLDLDTLGLMNATAAEYVRYGLKAGEILIDRSSVKLEGVGYPTVFPISSEAVVFCGFIIRFRISDERLRPAFAVQVMRSSAFRRLVFQVATASANVNVNQQALKRLPMVIPSAAEQLAIEERVEVAHLALEKELETARKLEGVKKGLMRDLLTGRVVASVDSAQDPKKFAANV